VGCLVLLALVGEPIQDRSRRISLFVLDKRVNNFHVMAKLIILRIDGADKKACMKFFDGAT
jgi:hypothetical protein